MSAQLWLTLCQVAIFAGAVLVGSASVASWYLRKVIEHQKYVEDEQKQYGLKFKIDYLTHSNDDLKGQLAPFEKIAIQKYPAIQRESALKKLATEVEAETEPVLQLPAPSFITQGQTDYLRSALADLKGEVVNILITVDQQELFLEAEQFKQIFTDAGLSVKGITKASYSKPLNGYMISVPDAKMTPKEKIFLNSFYSANIPVKGMLDVSQKGPELIFIIGPRNDEAGK